jgi:hypothetical protein
MCLDLGFNSRVRPSKSTFICQSRFDSAKATQYARASRLTLRSLLSADPSRNDWIPPAFHTSSDIDILRSLVLRIYISPIRSGGSASILRFISSEYKQSPKHPPSEVQILQVTDTPSHTLLFQASTKVIHHVFLCQLRSRLPWPHQPEQRPMCRLHHTQSIPRPLKQRNVDFFNIGVLRHERSIRVARRHPSSFIILTMNDILRLGSNSRELIKRRTHAFIGFFFLKRSQRRRSNGHFDFTMQSIWGRDHSSIPISA